MAFSTKGIAAAAIATCAVVTAITFIPPEGISTSYTSVLDGSQKFQSKENFAKQYDIHKQKQEEVDRKEQGVSGAGKAEATPGKMQGLWSKADGTNVSADEFNEQVKQRFGDYFDTYYEFLGIDMEAAGSVPLKADFDPFANKFDDGIGLIHYYQGGTAPWAQFNQNITKGGSATIGGSGCGPTGLSIIMSTMLHRYITPLEVVAARATYGIRMGLDPAYMNDANLDGGSGAMCQSSPKVCELVNNLKYNGDSVLTCTLGAANQADVDKTLDAGGMVLIVVHKEKPHGDYWVSGTGHYIVIRARDSSGKYYTSDGTHDQSTGTNYDLGNTNNSHDLSLIIAASKTPGSTHYIVPGPGYDAYINSLESSSGSSGGGNREHYSAGEIVLPTTDKYYQYLFTDTSKNVPTMKCYKYETEVENKKNKTVYLDPGHGIGKNGIDYTSVTERTLPLPNNDPIYNGKSPLLGAGVESKSPEDKFNWDVAQQLKDILLDRGYDVVMSKDALERESSNGGSARLATMTSDIMVSIHWNGSKGGSYNSDGSINTPGSASGTEVYYLEENPPAGKYDYTGICSKLGISTALQANNKKLANIISNKVSSVGFNNRGITNSIYRILVYSEIPTVLIETGFGDNPSDRSILDSKRPEIATAIADGIDEYFGN